jgi:hypothetical protein
MEVLRAAIDGLLSQSRFTLRHLSKVIGVIDATGTIVPMGRWRARPLHWFRKLHWDGPTTNFDKVVTLDRSFPVAELVWWKKPANVLVGVPLHEPNPEVLLFTDASMEGWGAHTAMVQAAGAWTAAQRKLHINVLELLAVKFALQALASHLRGRTVQVHCDNSTAIAYLRKGGGTHSLRLHTEATAIFQECLRESIHLLPLHIPGKRNVLADALSRPTRLPLTEWTLRQDVCDQLFDLWGKPAIDLFATSRNARLPRFVAPLPEPAAEAVDALTYSWDREYFYLFPPFTLLPRVLRKIREADSATFMLIAPCWPNQPWFVEVLKLLIDHPRILPVWPAILSQNRGQFLHPNPSALHLHGWLLSSAASLRKDFQAQLEDAWPSPLEVVQPRFTIVNGGVGRIGVCNGKVIQATPL